MLQRFIRDELEEVLDLCRNANIERTSNHIRVHAADSDGFDVRWIETPPEVTICFGGWNISFADAQSAVRLFRLGLTRDCRLTVEKVGEKPRRWLVERRETAKGPWQEIGESSLLIMPLWRPVTSIMLQNNWIAMAEAPSTTSEPEQVALQRVAN